MLAACNFGGNEGSSTMASMVIIDTHPDSMYYGLCIETRGKDSLLFLADEGDTTWLHLADDARKAGYINADDRVAIIKADKDGSEISLFINVSMLMGEWVQPDPMSEGSLTGFMLAEGGAAQSINISDRNHDNWRIVNGRLLLDISYTEGFGQNYTDTFTITRLTTDTLWLQGSDRMFLHRLRSGEATDISSDYAVDPSLGMDYSPELSEQDIPEGEPSPDGMFYDTEYDVAP